MSDEDIENPAWQLLKPVQLLMSIEPPPYLSRGAVHYRTRRTRVETPTATILDCLQRMVNAGRRWTFRL